MTSQDYWEECLAQAFESAGIAFTKEQLQEVAYDVEGAHETYGMAFYSPPATEYLDTEIERLKFELKKERSLVFCKECKATGRIYTQGPYHGSDSDCWKCGGSGRHA